MKLSFVMASLNEAQSIGGMIREIKKFAPPDTEILLVDSSTDKTPEIAKSLGARVISQKPQGHGMALKHGLNQAQGDMVITADCDLTYPTDKVPTLISMIENENYDLVSGCRMTKKLKKEMPFLNKCANAAFAFIVRWLHGVDTHDVSTGMFAMKKDYAHTDWVGNFSLPAEIIMRSKLMNKKYKEIPIDYKLRVGVTTLPRWRAGKAYIKSFFYWKFGWFKGHEL